GTKKRRGGRVIGEERGKEEGAPPAFAAEPPGPVPVARNHEQEADIAECDGDNDPALQHDVSTGPWGREARRCILPHEWGSENIAGSLAALPRRGDVTRQTGRHLTRRTAGGIDR